MEIELGQLIRAIRRWLWVPVVIGLVLGLLGFGAAQVAGSTSYTASTQMLVTAQISGDAVLADSSRTATYLNMTTSGPVLDRVILELGLDFDRQELAERVDARTISGTQIIEVSVTTDDPQLSADIANAITRNFVTTANDLSLGELERNRDDLLLQANSLRDRITTIDARLAELDTDEATEDSQAQAEIRQLERERIEASQTLADLERTIRELNTSLSRMSIPVVITDFAVPPEEGERTSPLLLALLGAFLGALIGAAWIIYSAFADKTLRSASQVAAWPIVAQLRRRDLGTDTSNALPVLAAKLQGAQTDSARTIAIVSARDSASVPDLTNQLSDRLSGDDHLVHANGVLDTPDALQVASNADAAIVVATVDETQLADFDEVVNVLEFVNTRFIGTVILSR